MKMKLFGGLMIAHWLEHLFQAYQVYVQHLDRACALGMLGMKYPWLVRTESLHFGFAILTVFGFWYAGQDYFENWTATEAWAAGFFVSIWHLCEHTVLFAQAATHHNLFGRSVPFSVLQFVFPRIELHLFYNSVVTILMVAALLIERQQPRYSVEPDWCDECHASQMVLPNGEHTCGVPSA